MTRRAAALPASVANPRPASTRSAVWLRATRFAGAAFVVGLASIGSALAANNPVSGPSAGPYKTFKDWSIGCDNMRACTAIGVAPDDSGSSYVRISRDGAADSDVRVSLVLGLENDSDAQGAPGAAKPSAPALVLSLTGHGAAHAGGHGTGIATSPTASPSVPVNLPAALAAPHRARIDNGIVRAELAGEQARAFVAALGQADKLTLTLVDASKAEASKADTSPAGHAGGSRPSGQVSLAGSAATLLFMDDQQKRLGTASALGAQKGDAAVPPLPPQPQVVALPITEVAKPGRAPAGLPKKPDGTCPDNLVYRLSAERTLWGVCSFSAAYNVGYKFWLVTQGGQKPQVAPYAFAIPGAADDLEGALGGPALSDDRTELRTMLLGRGLGDCGAASDWAWDGSVFKPLRLVRMDTCRGVLPDDWPVLLSVRKVQG